MDIRPTNNAVEKLRQYIDFSLLKNNAISFFILNGLEGSGKSAIIQKLSKDILGDFFFNDFLYIKDFSSILGKTHHIRVQQKDNEIYKTLLKEFDYQDIGTREINNWLQTSPAGVAKILFIENIERMTTSAINAFLKTCEEPLPQRIIVATTSNKSQILDTIVSRAIVVDMMESETTINSSISKDVISAIKILSSDINIYEKHAILTAINKKGFIKQFLDQLIGYYTSHNDFASSEKRLKIKKMAQTNVNIDSLLFYGLLD